LTIFLVGFQVAIIPCCNLERDRQRIGQGLLKTFWIFVFCFLIRRRRKKNKNKRTRNGPIQKSLTSQRWFKKREEENKKGEVEEEKGDNVI
jgi:hypothetical protein